MRIFCRGCYRERRRVGMTARAAVWWSWRCCRDNNPNGDKALEEFWAFSEQYARKVRESGRDHTRGDS